MTGPTQKMSAGQQRNSGAPHSYVPGSHLLMNSTQPAPTVPNIGTQTIGAPTSLGISSFLGVN